MHGADHAARLGNNVKERAEFTTGLAFAMMQMPVVLSQCHLSRKQVTMLIDGIKAMGSGIKWEFFNGGVRTTTGKLADDMATSIEDWSNRRWNSFGGDIGKLAQEMAEVVFPQKYMIDDNGALRKLIEEAEDVGGTTGGSAALTPLFLGGTVLLLLAALVAIKSRRSLEVWRRHWCSEKDLDLAHGHDIDGDAENGVASSHAEYSADPATRKLLECESVE